VRLARQERIDVVVADASSPWDAAATEHTVACGGAVTVFIRAGLSERRACDVALYTLSRYSFRAFAICAQLERLSRGRHRRPWL